VSPSVPEIAVTDTHALIWWLGGMPQRLGRRARQFFQRVDAGHAVLCIPAVTFVELSEAMHLGRVSLGEPFDAFVDRLVATPSRYQFVSLTPAIVARSHRLVSIPERGDRLIAATALELAYPLMTRDPSIVAAIGGTQLW